MSQYPDCLIYAHTQTHTHTHTRLQRHAYCVVRILISMCIEKAKQPAESHVVVYEIGDVRYDNVHRKVDEIPTTMPSHFILIPQYFFHQRICFAILQTALLLFRTFYELQFDMI